MILRDSTIDDAEMLLAWRNSDDARYQSSNAYPIAKLDHYAWFVGVLRVGNPPVIGVVDGVDVGYVRMSIDGRLSWFVDAEHRGKGYAKAMVCAFVKNKRRYYASIKASNVASIKVAQAAGMKLVYQCGEWNTYEKEAK